ncbi:MAG: inorganic phosphate transporter [Paludibacteraceae bacterium]|jgi:inorganic phosphate transporter, PiT family|nr:inorganic phosphate transporter [Paludibacteraceae bacterium]HOH95580.1 inorganic phosphate transporter [Candidatus Enterocola sp.]
MVLLIVIIVLAISFDYINGFHDAANSIATIVSTRILTPFQAVLWAAFFNFSAFFIAKYIIGEFGIADTVSKTVFPEFITMPIILSGIIAAIIWNLLTWRLGIPSSSSHTLIGGFAGAAIAATGFQAIHTEVIIIIAIFIFIAPLVGMIGGNLMMILTLHIVRKAKPHKADKWFKRAQLLSSALLSIGHGLNDSQKIMGIIAAALISFSSTHTNVPHWLQLSDIHDIHDWVPIACFTAIAAGTMSGGWRIMKTMGDKITKLTPVEGFCAETSGAITLFLTEVLKVPVSTTHVITGSIIGVGSVKRLSAVRWGVTVDLLVAWILTIPVSAVLAMSVYFIVSLFL